MKRNRSLFLGLLIGIGLLSIAAGQSYIDRYRYGDEALSRLASGYTTLQSFETKSLGLANGDTIATDSGSVIWNKTGAVKIAGRAGQIYRFNKSHVAMINIRTRDVTAADAVCTLYVFSGGEGQVDTARIYQCADTLIVPKIRNVYVAAQNGGFWESGWLPLSVDSILASTGTDSIASFELWAIGDSMPRD